MDEKNIAEHRTLRFFIYLLHFMDFDKVMTVKMTAYF